MEAVINNNPAVPANGKHPGGRPRIYETPEDIESVIEQYFNSLMCPQLSKDGEVIADKNGEPIYIISKPPTMTGLAYYLGLKSRQALINYRHQSEEFNDTISRAKMRIQEYVETRLFDRDGVNGAKYSLPNNFPDENWRENKEVSHILTLQFTPQSTQQIRAAVDNIDLLEAAQAQLPETVIEAQYEEVDSTTVVGIE